MYVCICVEVCDKSNASLLELMKLCRHPSLLISIMMDGDSEDRSALTCFGNQLIGMSFLEVC